MTGPATTEPGVLHGAGLRRVVAVLCVTEIVSWGVLYYAFPVLNPAITTDTGWSAVFTTAAFSASLVMAGVVGIPVGRLIDRWGPRPVMTAGSLLAAPAVCVIAWAPTQAWFAAGWLLAGVAMAAVLYTPAFTAIARWGGARALGGLTAVTLVAGFASTVFAPLTAVLEAHLGWRTALLVLAAVLFTVTVPAHAVGLRQPWAPAPPRPPAAERPVGDRRAFVMLAVVMSLAAFAVYAVIVNLVPLLVERGVSVTDAALVLGVGGAGQVAGRLLYGRLSAATSVVVRTVLVLALVAVTTAAFAVVTGPLALLFAVSALAGAARGITTLLQATAVPDRWGTDGIGRLNGLLSAPVMVTTALAPFAAVAIAVPLGGLAPVFLLLAGFALAAALLVPTTMPARLPLVE